MRLVVAGRRVEIDREHGGHRFALPRRELHLRERALDAAHHVLVRERRAASVGEADHVAARRDGELHRHASLELTVVLAPGVEALRQLRVMSFDLLQQARANDRVLLLLRGPGRRTGRRRSGHHVRDLGLDDHDPGGRAARGRGVAGPSRRLRRAGRDGEEARGDRERTRECGHAPHPCNHRSRPKMGLNAQNPSRQLATTRRSCVGEITSSPRSRPSPAWRRPPSPSTAPPCHDDASFPSHELSGSAGFP